MKSATSGSEQSDIPRVTINLCTPGITAGAHMSISEHSVLSWQCASSCPSLALIRWLGVWSVIQGRRVAAWFLSMATQCDKVTLELAANQLAIRGTEPVGGYRSMWRQNTGFGLRTINVSVANTFFVTEREALLNAQAISSQAQP